MDRDPWTPLHPSVAAYLERFTPPRGEVLREMEAYAAERRFPIVGPAVGQLFYLLTRLSGARRVFEMGSGFGYSTAWFALAVRDNGGGEVFHVVWDAQLSEHARGYLRRLGVDHLVRFRVNEAVDELRRTEGPFDIIFNDIEKPGYPASLPVIKHRLAPGGLLLADNMLWGGRVLDPAPRDEAARGVREFTSAVFADRDFVSTILPLRDGVLLAQKRPPQTPGPPP
jgi:predicted O-methyltransferase YrrM